MIRCRNRWFITALLATGAACGAPDLEDDLEKNRQRFVGGQPNMDLPGVGYLVRDGVVSCSASLVEPDVVLTAAHCASNEDERIEFGWGETHDRNTVPVISRALHPRYVEPPRNGGVVFEGFDVALLELEHAVDLPPVGLGPTPRSGKARAIGYGATSYVEHAEGKIEPRGIGTERRSAEGVVVGVNPTEVFVRFDLGASACYGDSGSPLLLEDGTVFGVLSRFTGITRCEPRMGSLMAYTRVDRMGHFFRVAKMCLRTDDVATCLRQDGLCDEPRFSNRAAPAPLEPSAGDRHRGVALYGLDAHEERAFVVTPPDDAVFTATAKGDAAIHLFVDGREVSGQTRRAELTRGTTYELVVRSCNGAKQSVALSWRPLGTEQ